jgi:hypothetical protein
MLDQEGRTHASYVPIHRRRCSGAAEQSSGGGAAGEVSAAWPPLLAAAVLCCSLLPSRARLLMQQPLGLRAVRQAARVSPPAAHLRFRQRSSAAVYMIALTRRRSLRTAKCPKTSQSPPSAPMLPPPRLHCFIPPLLPDPPAIPCPPAPTLPLPRPQAQPAVGPRRFVPAGALHGPQRGVHAFLLAPSGGGPVGGRAAGGAPECRLPPNLWHPDSGRRDRAVPRVSAQQ